MHLLNLKYNITVKNTVITFKKQSLLLLRAFKVLLFASIHISFLSKGVVSCDITRGQEVDLSFMMPNKCVAYSCSNSSKDDGISDEKLRKKWIMQVSKTRDKWKLKPNAILSKEALLVMMVLDCHHPS